MIVESNSKINYYYNVYKMYLYWFCHSLIFAYVIERLYGLERGITIQQMVYIEIMYAAVMLLLEVPTGILADTWSRKKVMVVSSVFIFFEIFILIYARDFTMFALSSVSAAIGGSLASGTANAIVYDSLKLEKKESEFEKILGRINVFSNISWMTGSVCGSLIAARYGFVYTYWLSLIGVTAALLVSFTFREPVIKEFSEAGEESISGFRFRDVIFFLKNSPAVRVVIILSVILGSAVTYLEEYWQVYLQEVTVPVYFFGAFSLMHGLMVSISSSMAYKLKALLGYNKTFIVSSGFIALLILATGYLDNRFGVITLLCVFLFYGMAETLATGYIHHAAESSFRATAESFSSLALSGGSIVIGLVFGYLTTKYNIFGGFRFLGAVVLIYLIYYLVIQSKYIRES